MATDLTTTELDAFRDDADRFIAELDEEYYLHLAGHKETLELEQIYEAHEELTRLDTAQRLEGAPTELWRFACEGFLGGLTREHAEKLADVEAELETTVDGEQIPYRMIRVVMSNEPDRDRRERLERARLELLDEHLNPVYLDAARIDREAVASLGSPNYYELYKRFGFELDELAAQCDLAPRRDRADVGAGRRPPLPRAPGHRPLRRAPLRRRRGSSAPPSSTRATPPTGCSPRSRRPSASSASTCAHRATCTSTSSRAPARARARSARRSRSPGR